MNRKTLKALFLIVTSAVVFAGCRKTNNLDYDNVANQEQQKEESKEQETVELTYDIYKDIKMVRCMSIQTEGLQTLTGI